MLKLFRIVNNREPLLSQTVIWIAFLIAAIGVYAGPLSWHFAQRCLLSSLFLSPSAPQYVYVYSCYSYSRPFRKYFWIWKFAPALRRKYLLRLLHRWWLEASSLAWGLVVEVIIFSSWNLWTANTQLGSEDGSFKHFSVKIYPPRSSGIFFLKWNSFLISIHLCTALGPYANRVMTADTQMIKSVDTVGPGQ